jgi:hypothetical protein
MTTVHGEDSSSSPFRPRSKARRISKTTADYLVEHAGGAILSWIIEGAKKAIDKRLQNPCSEMCGRCHPSLSGEQRLALKFSRGMLRDRTIIHEKSRVSFIRITGPIA